MIECPNCGMENASSRAFCSICGERLPQETPRPTGSLRLLGLAENRPAAPLALPTFPPSDTEEAGVEWLLDDSESSPAPNEAVPQAPPPAIAPPVKKPSPPPSQSSGGFLPAWLVGTELDAKPAPPPIEWTDRLDFSNLPGWTSEAPRPAPTPGAPPRPNARRPDADNSIWFNDEEGKGLLAGVRGPIPLRPASTLSRGAAPFLPQTTPALDSTGANLFAQITGGVVAAPTIAPPQRASRGSSLLNLLLLLAVIIPILLSNLPLFGATGELRAAAAYAETVEAALAQGTVLLAFDYEGGMRDEVEPGAIATLNHLRSLAGDDTNGPRLVAVSLTPQGPALAERAWAASEGAALPWRNLGFLPGGVVGLRALLAEEVTEDQRSATGLEAVSLIIVLGSETADVQRWIEQVGSAVPNAPLLAVAPALAETTLAPYLASGQLDGLLAGVPGAASYEAHGVGQSGAAGRRIHALTLAGLVSLGVMVAGAIAGRRERAANGEPL